MAKNILQDSTVLVVSKLEGRIYASDRSKCFFCAVGSAGADFHFLARHEILREAIDLKYLKAGKAERLQVFIG